MNIEQDLTELVASAANLPPEEVAPDADFFEEGWIDSLGLFRLVVEAEQRLGIKLPGEALLDQRATSVAGLTKLFRQAVDEP